MMGSGGVYRRPPSLTPARAGGADAERAHKYAENYLCHNVHDDSPFCREIHFLFAVV